MKKYLKKHSFFLLATLAFCLSLCGTTVAQEINANIVGTVRDANGAPVAGATVTITDVAKNNIVVRTVTTNDDGEYSARELQSGLYTVTVEASNFKKSVQTDVKLEIGQRRTVDVALEAGNITEVVTVQADPVAVELTTPTVSTIINGDQARELSLNNRNWVQLVTLAPGVSNDLADQVYVGTTNPAGQANTINISVNGARSSQNTFTVDGADVTDRGSNITIQAYPSVDSIGEFAVLRSLYPAESGRSGGGQVNIVTRSGGRRFSGSLFEFVRNEKLNANDFLTNASTNPAFGRNPDNGKAKRSPFRYNNYGFTIGGPVYFFNFGEGEPGGSIFKRLDRTFFFFSEEQRKDIRYPTLNSTVPSALLRTGRFTVPICLQATGTTCNTTLNAGDPLPAINPLAQQYLNFIYNKLPLPNNPAAGPFSLSFAALNKSDFRQEIIKIDHSFSDNWSMYYRFENDKIPTIDVNSLFSSGSGLPGVATTSTNSPGKTHTFQSTHVIRPNLVAVGRFTYGYGAILSSNIGTLALANSPITPPLPYVVTRDRVPSISNAAGATNGFSGLVSFGPYDNFSYKENFSGDLTWVKGNHSIKFGSVFSYYRKNENAIAGNNEGIFSNFNTPGATAVVLPTGGNTSQQQFANFLLGTNVSFTQARFDYTADLRQLAWESYVQDEWKVRPNLTLYYGVRHSYFGAPMDKNGRMSNFVPELFNPAEAPLVTGAGNRVAAAGKNFCNGIIVNNRNYQTAANCTPRGSQWGDHIMEVSKTDFAPRFGLAWDPFKKGTTSIRMGYGIYHEQVLNGTILQHIGLNPPYQETCAVTGVLLSNPVPGGSCAAAASATAANVRGIQANWDTPYTQHWSLNWQQQLTNNTVFSLGYFGSKGVHLIGAIEINELPPGEAIRRGPTGCATGTSTTPSAPCQVAGQAFLSSAATNILDQIRPYRGYRSINIVTPQFNSNYHSLQAFITHRFTGASQVNVAYTWAKNLTDNQTDRSTAPQNSFDIKSDYGRATLDRRHIFTANYIYELPFFRKQENFVGKVLGGWQASGVITMQSGLPFTITTSNFDPSGLGNNPALVAGNRPFLYCDPNSNAPHTFSNWILPLSDPNSCYRANPTAAINGNVPGTSPRGAVNGPPTYRVDFTMSKNIRFGENYRLQLRAEAFNVFNHTNFRTFVTNVTTAGFGSVTAVRDPRTMQLGIKFNF